MEAYLARIRRLTDDLKVKKLAIPEKVIAAYTLNNLTPDYEHTVAIISQSFRTAGDQIDLTQLYGQLVDESRRLKAREPKELALTSQNSNNGGNTVRPKCPKCHKRGHTE